MDTETQFGEFFFVHSFGGGIELFEYWVDISPYFNTGIQILLVPATRAQLQHAGYISSWHGYLVYYIVNGTVQLKFYKPVPYVTPALAVAKWVLRSQNPSAQFRIERAKALRSAQLRQSA